MPADLLTDLGIIGDSRADDFVTYLSGQANAPRVHALPRNKTRGWNSKSISKFTYDKRSGAPRLVEPLARAGPNCRWIVLCGSNDWSSLVLPELVAAELQQHVLAPLQLARRNAAVTVVLPLRREDYVRRRRAPCVEKTRQGMLDVLELPATWRTFEPTGFVDNLHLSAGSYEALLQHLLRTSEAAATQARCGLQAKPVRDPPRLRPRHR